MKGLGKVAVGKKFRNIKGYHFTVVDYENYNRVKIRFDEPKVSYKYTCSANILTGKIANPYHKIASGVGFMGEGLYQVENDPKLKKVLSLWRAILKRCYESGTNKTYKTYEDCTVHEDWHNFQNFAAWYVNHEYYGFGYDLDKDLLVRGNKVYSAETCCMLPHQLNTSLPIVRGNNNERSVGVYKNRQNKYQVAVTKDGKRVSLGVYITDVEASDVYKDFKRKVLVDLAEKWKYLVAVDVYESLLNFEV